jgi:hypothetical protein
MELSTMTFTDAYEYVSDRVVIGNLNYRHYDGSAMCALVSLNDQADMLRYKIGHFMQSGLPVDDLLQSLVMIESQIEDLLRGRGLI